MKVIFVPLQGSSRDAQALESAYVLAQQFGAHIDCLHVRQDPRLLVASTAASMEPGLGTGVFPSDLWEAFLEADRKLAKQAHETFDAFCKKHSLASTPGTTASAAYREVEGDESREITSSARYADLVSIANDSLYSETSLDTTGDLIVGCGRPVLITPEKHQIASTSTVAIAWKETAEAARAVTAAMPVLLKAKTVVVLAAREGSQKIEDVLRTAERVAALLRAHGIAARAEHVSADHGTPDALIDRAIALKADLLVMGAYGHNRLREFVFGGFTQHVLNHPKLAVLLAH